MIRYYEGSELKEEYLWKDLVYQKSEFESFTLYFSNGKSTLWIPRIIVDDKEELAKFETSIKESLNTRERAE